MKPLFAVCTPRADVLRGNIKESDFAADLAQVINGNAPPEYQDPTVFFANTYPTDGLKLLLENVCLRLSGKGGEAASIFRLDTQYGGGKTHSLIALTHAARGMQGVSNTDEFLDPKILPSGEIRVAAFDGENADPVNGRPLGEGLKAFTPWGELAYALAGVAGYEAVRASDVERVAPGADTIRQLFGGNPSLILLDELSIYLRKVKERPEAEQLTPFLTSLFKAIESSPGAVLVFTLAIGKGGEAVDAYSAENEFVARQLEEAEKVAARKATMLDPTAEHETAQVLRRRLFDKVDMAAAEEIISAYQQLWISHAADLPTAKPDEDREGDFRRGFPFHPALMSTLTDKLSTLSNFQRVRGMLRLLTQTTAHLWKKKPVETYAIHLHHLDPSFGPTRNEIVTRLEMSAFDPAIRNDVAAKEGGKALAQTLDVKHYSGMAPYGSYVARNILWHTFAFNEHIKGAAADELRYSILAPSIDASFINDARQKFIAESAYLDDRPGIALRFLTEANLTQMVRRMEALVDHGEARAQLQDRIRSIFAGSTLQLIPFTAGPYDVPDEVGDGRPLLALISYDATTVRNEALSVPELVESIHRHTGSQNAFRQLQNNVVFLLADDSARAEMKAKMVRRLALEAMRHPDRLQELAEHQQEKISELHSRSEQELAVAIQQCYRHLFYPSRNNRVEGAKVDLGHTAFDTPSASEQPGSGQKQVLRALKDVNKLLRADDHPLAPNYVRDQTPLKKGQISTAALRAEFRKDPRLPVMIGDENFVALVRKGIEDGTYIYQSGDLLAGQGDPFCEVRVDEQSIVFTMPYAKEQGLWPRPAPKPESPPIGGTASPTGSVGGAEAGTVGETSTSYDTGGGQTFTAEAPLREALTQIWEAAKSADVKAVKTLSLRVFDAGDAFKLLSAVNAVSGAEKNVTMRGEYETGSSSNFAVTFEGIPSDAEPLKEFLVPQFRDAKASGGETDLETTYSFTFEEGLSLGSDATTKFTERLSRFASGAVFVVAKADAEK